MTSNGGATGCGTRPSQSEQVWKRIRMCGMSGERVAGLLGLKSVEGLEGFGLFLYCFSMLRAKDLKFVPCLVNK
jgi:hypothetical protein